MSMIEYDIECLKTIAEYEPQHELIINSAIATIKDLSAKLSAANMERSSMHYNGGWIPCSERLPSGDSICLITIQCNDDKEEFGIDMGFYNGERNTWNAYSYDCDDLYSVIAWMPLPEPYKPKESENNE